MVAGIAMGLMVKSEEKGIIEGEYVILTDIQGLEDHIGDMDFKVAGTRDGITALQMDIKVKGITTEVLEKALAQAKQARLFIMEKMAEVIAKPREHVSQFAPKIEVIKIEKEQIGEVIGSGGKVIRNIIETTGAQVDIDEEGKVVVSSIDAENVRQAIKWIEGITREVEVGEVFEDAKVVKITDFGAFVEYMPGREGLVHVSQMSCNYVSNPSEVVSEGQKVKVRVDSIDELGRVRLSMLFGDDIEKAKQNGGSRGGRDQGGQGGGFRGGERRFGGRDQRNFRDRQPGFRKPGGFERRSDFAPKPKTSTTPKTMADWNNDN